MKVATWNVNSVRTRLDDVLQFLGDEQPDVLCLQELKCDAASYPALAIRAAGYTSAIFGQPAYNGVGILSRLPIERIRDGLDGDVAGVTPQARAISARIGGIEFLNLYIPNGDTVGSAKWRYKLAWLQLLEETIEGRFFDDEPLIILGDFNIAPKDIDVHAPDAWRRSVLCAPEVRQHFERLEAWGLRDLVRAAAGEDETIYTWWDYRGDAFSQNDGLRIDHLMGTAPIAARVASWRVATEMRATSKPSDHAPVIIQLN